MDRIENCYRQIYVVVLSFAIIKLFNTLKMVETTYDSLKRERGIFKKIVL